MIALPTLADKILRLKNSRNPLRRTHVITLMGATIAMQPTFAREIEDMIRLRQSGTLPESEISRLWQEAIGQEFDLFEYFTLMGGAAEERPTQKQELADLRRIASRGVISNEEYREISAALEAGEFSGVSRAVQNRLQDLLFAPPAPEPLGTSAQAEEPRKVGQF